MALVPCPECGREVSDQALACPHCGYPIGGGGGYEYRSERQIFGLPLVHIVSGNRMDPATGRPRVAKGIIAIGPIAVGGLALGGSAFGVVSFGGAALGLIAIGGVAIGALLALGGMAIGLVALGGGAIGYYALGGWTLGAHALGGNAQDPNTIEFFRRWFHFHDGGR
ncbi:MAG: zinc ribbon domain-containing protein [Planctomycetes bacterium]|nr:zinc ribbon domain-containing protein [Planctomycetota bacterium]